MVKNIFIYGGILGGVLLLLNAFEYFFWVRMNFVELYIAIIASVFLAIGIWFGNRKVSKLAEDKLVTEPNLQAHELGISKREMEVLVLVNKGLSNQEIADILFVSNNTIKTHTSNIFEKLEVKNRTQAILKAKNVGILA